MWLRNHSAKKVICGFIEIVQWAFAMALLGRFGNKMDVMTAVMPIPDIPGRVYHDYLCLDVLRH